MSLSIVIPAHNEAQNIAKVITSIERIVSVEHEVIIVDDHSTDSTAEVVKRMAADFKNIRLVGNDFNRGFANALRKGFACVESTMVVPVMADLCDDPHTINRMYELAYSGGYDIVCGSRYMKGGRKQGGPKLKTFFSRFVGLSLNMLIGIPTKDISNSFKLYRREVIEKTHPESDGFEISVEIPLKAYFLGYKITEIPTVWVDRKEGKSKFNVFKQCKRYLGLYLWAIKKKITNAKKKNC
ncbi:MAG: glycosyltransferase family 2 protein [Candidatus Omnitrophota bacterium]|nr:MAG: glycosyltransferase family 2 protein [Candidatus Omnitrophota bacterium]